ncbi:cadherin-like beta sandwich domain-containing protein [Lysinibacillus piscis]|uniref:SLH domain-containing protein n=1 Tax=Lysinibacillus piscis TaxID=2518931 RepID=A0ABQ5NJ52_9BACI|nr:cadherin-like beta sandwich domain-containing protein [Lysinibacillus sp. KH24]GLC88054.1 hypothetical protein LYSBPC_11810 [Lysinibacillus sp. KH24]
MKRSMSLVTVCILILSLIVQPPFAYAGTGGEISTVAGGRYGELGDGGLAVDAELANPSAVAVDNNGNLYIADTTNNKIRKVDAITKEISTIAGNGTYGYSGDGNSALNAELRSPSGVAVDADGNIYITDKYNNRIRKVGTDGIISTVVGTGESDFGGDNSSADTAKIKSPSGIMIDNTGSLYIADTGNHRIRKVTNGIITTIAGAGYGTFSGDGGPAVDAELNYPQTIAMDNIGNLYIADTNNNRIRKVDTNGIISTVAGSGSRGYSGDGGLAIDAQLNEPEGITVDSSGNLYIADTDNYRIRKVMPSGRISTIAGTGNYGYSGDGGSGTLAQLNGPVGLALDNDANLYIADKFNYAIRKQTSYIPSSDVSLNNITLSSGTLSPAFAANTTNYTASVVNGISTIRITPTTADNFITVKVNGEDVASGTQSGDINLNVGDNPITLVALAEDGVTTKTYTIVVKRLASSDASLGQLALSTGTLSPAFNFNTTSYSANVSQSAITVTPTALDPLATVKVNGQAVTNGTVSQTIPLNIGSNPITVIVTAQNGTTTKTYTIDVTRTIGENTDLSGLLLSDGTLSPAFGAGTTSYTSNVDHDIKNIIITPTAADASATVTVNGGPITNGTALIPLMVGDNTIAIQVTAEDGLATKIYTVVVNRAKSKNADLSDLTLSSGELLPSFVPGTFKTSVDYQVSSITVMPTLSDTVNATATVSLYSNSGVLVSGPFPVASGTMSPSLPLSIGNNTIMVLVTAHDGTTKTYTVTVKRGTSSNTDLNNLTLSSGTLIPAFAGTYVANVEHSVSSITVTPTLSDAMNATVTVGVYNSGGTLISGPFPVQSGAPSPALALSVGNNEIRLNVTAQGQTTRTYTINVVRARQVEIPKPPSGGGTLPSTPTEVIPTPPVDKSLGTVKIEIDQASGSITSFVNITPAQIVAAISKVQSINNAMVRIAIQNEQNAANHMMVAVPKESTKILHDKGVGLEIATNDAQLVIENSSMEGVDSDFYFGLNLEQKDNERTVRKVLANNNIHVVTNPVTIETNLPKRPVVVTLPLKDVTLPTNSVEREAFLASLSIFIEHSDGEKKVVTPKVTTMTNGQVGLRFTVNKFSTFTIIQTAEETTDTHTAYIKGYSDGTFGPERNVTRAQVATMIARILGYQDGTSVSVAPFKDIASTHHAVGAIAFVKEQGIMNGDANGNFRAEENITRAQMATVVANFKQLHIEENVTITFNDTNGHWAQWIIEANRAAGIINGRQDGSFAPDAHLTRAQAVVMMNRMFEREPLSGIVTPSFTDVKATHWAFKEIEAAINIRTNN